VIRAFSIFAVLIAAFVAFVCSGAQAAGPVQTLGIVLQRNAAATERLPHYRTAAPIVVKVGGDADRLTSLTVTAHGPGGEAITTLLARSGNAFTGNLHLIAPGTWTVAFSTQLGSVSAALASVPLDVVSEDGTDIAARLAFALAALSVAAGLALVLRVDGRPLALAYVRKRS
jgi:hypothetical protein